MWNVAERLIVTEGKKQTVCVDDYTIGLSLAFISPIHSSFNQRTLHTASIPILAVTWRPLALSVSLSLSFALFASFSVAPTLVLLLSLSRRTLPANCGATPIKTTSNQHFRRFLEFSVSFVEQKD